MAFRVVFQRRAGSDIAITLGWLAKRAKRGRESNPDLTPDSFFFTAVQAISLTEGFALVTFGLFGLYPINWPKGGKPLFGYFTHRLALVGGEDRSAQ